jgi:hypothetical protein
MEFLCRLRAPYTSFLRIGVDSVSLELVLSLRHHLYHLCQAQRLTDAQSSLRTQSRQATYPYFLKQQEGQCSSKLHQNLQIPASFCTDTSHLHIFQSGLSLTCS